MSTITVYQPGDTTTWIPVTKQTKVAPPRAFLPLQGASVDYQHGYKAKQGELNAPFFTALATIQRGWLDNTSAVFNVDQKNKDEERQYLAGWLDLGIPQPSRLSPTKGWVKVKCADLAPHCRLTYKQLGDALDALDALDASAPLRGTKLRFADLK